MHLDPTVKPILSGHSKRRPNLVFKTNYCLMQVKSIVECSPWSILQSLLPSLSYHLSLRSLFCLVLSGCLRQVLLYSYSQCTVKPVLSGHSKRRPKLVLKTDYRLMQVKSIAECSKGSILQYFRPSLSYHLSLRSSFCLFLSGRLRQVLLYYLFCL